MRPSRRRGECRRPRYRARRVPVEDDVGPVRRLDHHVTTKDHSLATVYSARMERRQLEYFLAVVEHGGFTNAARAMYVAQPSLSHAIAALEAELGGALFHRLPHG